MVQRVFCLIIVIWALLPLPLYASGRSDRERRRPRAADRSVPEEPAGEPARRRPRPSDSPAPKTESIPDSKEVESGPIAVIGTDEGLFAVDSAGNRTALWLGGSVKKMMPVVTTADMQSTETVWVILGSEGILISTGTDMREWEPRNEGLPVKMIKIFQNREKTFLPMVQEIKDVKMNPADPNIMVCATKDRVYLSRNQGREWTSLGAPPYRTNGIKAVASAYLPRTNGQSELVVFMSHSTYGIFYIQPDKAGAQWVELENGIETLETTGNPDEVSDIIVVLDETSSEPVIYASQTFRRRIYKLDWENKKFNLIWTDDDPFGTADSLYAGKSELYFLQEGTVASLDFEDFTMREHPEILNSIRATATQGTPNCTLLTAPMLEEIILSELWLLDEPKNITTNNAANKEGLYLPVNHAMDSKSLKPYLDVIERAGLNLIVIDMKDDYGRLRFTPNNTAISDKGRVFRPLDIDAFLADMKERGIYTVARIVVFKDPELAGKENGKYAVWDSRNGKPWVGYYDVRRKKSDISNEDRKNRLLQFFPADDPAYEIVRTFYDERWVDPYSEEVWEYTAATAEELHERGFDEIQFDYIRFPTDGENLYTARYRWQENGMDMESALLSFLRHVRLRVKAPISIDIYGANGWYRTGARTGQEVEMLAPWVDVICPMYYPSHFEQHFLAQNPPELRPWRIYYQGALRTARIGRGQVIVRPYAQAFFLNVSYDRKYYNADYVRYQTEGVRAAGLGGLTYWNNSGRYDDLPNK